MHAPANRYTFYPGYRRAILAIAISGLTSFLTRPAAATVCITSCLPYECGFEVANVRCAVVPANYQLEVAVDCSDAIGIDALPILVLEDGTALASEWRPRDRLWGTPEYWFSAIQQSRNFYVRVGPTLPANAIVRVVHRVPERCTIASIRACSSSARVACVEGTASCCGAFDAARIPFAADGVLSVGFARATSSGGGGSGGVDPLGANLYEYSRFRTAEADHVAPPALSVQLECELDETVPTRPLAIIHSKLSTPSGETPDLTDVVEAAIFAQSPQALTPREEVVYRAPVCAPGSPPSSPFELSGQYFTSLNTGFHVPTTSSQWTYFVRTYDAAGNVSQGPPTTLTIPDGCTHGFTPRKQMLPMRLCSTPASPGACEAVIASAGAAGASNAQGAAASPSSPSGSPLNSGGRPNLDAVCSPPNISPPYTPLILGEADPIPASGGAATSVYAPRHTNSSTCSLSVSSNGSGPWIMAGLALVAATIRRRT